MAEAQRDNATWPVKALVGNQESSTGTGGLPLIGRPKWINVRSWNQNGIYSPFGFFTKAKVLAIKIYRNRDKYLLRGVKDFAVRFSVLVRYNIPTILSVGVKICDKIRLKATKIVHNSFISVGYPGAPGNIPTAASATISAIDSFAKQIKNTITRLYNTQDLINGMAMASEDKGALYGEAKSSELGSVGNNANDSFVKKVFSSLHPNKFEVYDQVKKGIVNFRCGLETVGVLKRSNVEYFYDAEDRKTVTMPSPVQPHYPITRNTMEHIIITKLYHKKIGVTPEAELIATQEGYEACSNDAHWKYAYEDYNKRHIYTPLYLERHFDQLNRVCTQMKLESWTHLFNDERTPLEIMTCFKREKVSTDLEIEKKMLLESEHIIEKANVELLKEEALIKSGNADIFAKRLENQEKAYDLIERKNPLAKIPGRKKPSLKSRQNKYWQHFRQPDGSYRTDHYEAALGYSKDPEIYREELNRGGRLLTDEERRKLT